MCFDKIIKSSQFYAPFLMPLNKICNMCTCSKVYKIGNSESFNYTYQNTKCQNKLNPK